MISISLKGKPIAAPRPRSTLGSRHVYNPPEYTAAKKQLAWEMRQQMGNHAPVTGVITVRVAFFFPVPAGWSQKRKNDAFWHTSKPDLDNLLKTILDVGNGLLWVDDCQISELTALKRYALPDQPGHTTIDLIHSRF